MEKGKKEKKKKNQREKNPGVEKTDERKIK